jgi:hypothetical protein
VKAEEAEAEEGATFSQMEKAVVKDSPEKILSSLSSRPSLPNRGEMVKMTFKGFAHLV